MQRGFFALSPMPSSLAKMPVRISVPIVACNEAANLRRTLASVAWVDEIVLIDSGSTDETSPSRASSTPASLSSGGRAMAHRSTRRSASAPAIGF